jgi:hypothetical protein
MKKTKKTIANPNTASVNLIVDTFNGMTGNGITFSTGAFDKASLQSSQKGQVTVPDGQTLKVMTPGGVVKMTIGVVDKYKTDDYFPIGMFVTNADNDAPTNLNNFPKDYVSVSDGTLTFFDTCYTADKKFEFYVVVQSRIHKTFGIIDPGISHDGAGLGGKRS